MFSEPLVSVFCVWVFDEVVISRPAFALLTYHNNLEIYPHASSPTVLRDPISDVSMRILVPLFLTQSLIFFISPSRIEHALI
jgi:hypothetical protein